MGIVRKHFTLVPDGEYSIEVDPRKVDEATVALLAELGFNRMSVGIQDFNPMCSKAVNRVQSEERDQGLVIDAARANGFKSVSVDLIYGLPKQNVISFNRTLEQSCRCRPTGCRSTTTPTCPACSSPAAHHRCPAAERRDQAADPPAGHPPQAHRGGLRPTSAWTTSPSRPTSSPRAQRQGRLHRNFQGYSTYAECDLMAFGVSAIGKVGPTYAQNVKTLDEYYDILDTGACRCCAASSSPPTTCCGARSSRR